MTYQRSRQSFGGYGYPCQSDLDDYDPMADDYNNPNLNMYNRGGPGYGLSMQQLTGTYVGFVKLHVYGIPVDMEWQGLRHIFLKYGRVEDAWIAVPNPGKMCTWGFVEYRTYNEAETAIRQLDGTPVPGCPNLHFRITYALTEEEKARRKAALEFDEVQPYKPEVNFQEEWRCNQLRNRPSARRSLQMPMYNNFEDDLEDEMYHDDYLPSLGRGRGGRNRGVENRSLYGRDQNISGTVGTSPPPLEVPEYGRCAGCGKLYSTNKCSGCGVFYCSKVCRNAHWPRHKQECQPRPGSSLDESRNATGPREVLGAKNNRNQTENDSRQPQDLLTRRKEVMNKKTEENEPGNDHDLASEMFHYRNADHWKENEENDESSQFQKKGERDGEQNCFINTSEGGNSERSQFPNRHQSDGERKHQYQNQGQTDIEEPHGKNNEGDKSQDCQNQRHWNVEQRQLQNRGQTNCERPQVQHQGQRYGEQRPQLQNKGQNNFERPQQFQNRGQTDGDQNHHRNKNERESTDRSQFQNQGQRDCKQNSRQNNAERVNSDKLSFENKSESVGGQRPCNKNERDNSDRQFQNHRQRDGEQKPRSIDEDGGGKSHFPNRGKDGDQNNYGQSDNRKPFIRNNQQQRNWERGGNSNRQGGGGDNCGYKDEVDSVKSQNGSAPNQAGHKQQFSRMDGANQNRKGGEGALSNDQDSSRNRDNQQSGGGDKKRSLTVIKQNTQQSVVTVKPKPVSATKEVECVVATISKPLATAKEFDVANEILKERRFDVACFMTPGEPNLVSVSYVTSPVLFWVQLQSNAAVITEMMSKLQTESKRVANLTVAKGDLCASQYDGYWYRARVTSACTPLSVFYIDYGNEEKVERGNLAPLSNQLQRTPPLAIQCSLNLYSTSITPPPPVISKAFAEAVQDRKVTRVIAKTTGVACAVATSVNVQLLLVGADGIEKDVSEQLIALEPAKTVQSIGPLANILDQVSQGEDFSATVTLMETDGTFWVMVLPSFIVQQAQTIITELDDDCNANSTQSSTSPSKGDLVCAYSPLFSMWFRAYVKEKIDDGFQVIYIDYGNEEVVKKTLQLPHKYKKAPALAVKCKPTNANTQVAVEDILTLNMKGREAKITRTDGKVLGQSSLDAMVDVILAYAKLITKDEVDSVPLHPVVQTQAAVPPVKVAAPPVKVVTPPVQVVAPPVKVTTAPVKAVTPPVQVTSLPTRKVVTPRSVISNLEPNVTVVGQILYTTSTSVLWVMLALDSIVEYITLLSTYSDDCEGIATDITASDGGLVSAFSPNDGAWYRAIVLRTCDGKHLVLYVDYGNEEEVTKLKQVPDTYKDIPTCALRCTLNVPCKLELVEAGTSITITVIEKQGNGWKVELESTNETSLGVATMEGVESAMEALEAVPTPIQKVPTPVTKSPLLPTPVISSHVPPTVKTATYSNPAALKPTASPADLTPGTSPSPVSQNAAAFSNPVVQKLAISASSRVLLSAEPVSLVATKSAVTSNTSTLKSVGSATPPARTQLVPVGQDRPKSILDNVNFGEVITLEVSVCNDRETWAFACTTESALEFQTVSLELEKLGNDSEAVGCHSSPGKMIAALSSLFGTWYRAYPQEGSNKVIFVDFGNDEEVTVMKDLTPSLLAIPTMSVKMDLPKDVKLQAEQCLTANVLSMADDGVNVKLATTEGVDLCECTLKAWYPVSSNLLKEPLDFFSPVPKNLPTPLVPTMAVVDAELFLYQNIAECNIDFTQEIFVTHCSRNKVYISPTGDDANKQKIQLMELLAVHCADEPPLDCVPQKGEVVGAIFENQYYRGSIISTEEDYALVHYLDFGNTSRMPISSLRTVDKEIMSFPKQTKTALLHGVPMRSVPIYYTETLQKLLEKEVIEKVLKVAVVTQTPTLEVKLLKNGHNVNEDICKYMEPYWQMLIREGRTDDNPIPLELQDVIYMYNDSNLPVVSLAVGKLEVIQIKQIFDYKEITCIKVDPKLRQQLQELSDSITEYCIKFQYTGRYTPRVGELVLTLDPVTGVWSRAACLSSNPASCKLFLVDEGKTTDALTTCIRRILPDFVYIPTQAIHCQLNEMIEFENESPELNAKVQALLPDDVVESVVTVSISEEHIHVITIPRVASSLQILLAEVM